MSLSFTLTGFSPHVTQALSEFIARNAASEVSGLRRVAVFDADGTLWHGDIGEAFFKHQIEAQTIPGAPRDNAWDIYWKEVECGEAQKAYGWLAQWNAGVRVHDLNQWSQEFYEMQWRQRVFQPMLALIQALHRAGFEVWVVSASPQWVVAAGAAAFDIPQTRIIATSAIVDDGVCSDRVERVPYRDAKAVLIKEKIGIQPLLAAGNTYWDKEMMETASKVALAVHSESEGEPSYHSEQQLQELALKKLWLRQKF